MILSFMLLCMWNISSPFSKNKMRNSRERPPKGGYFLARNSQKYVAIHTKENDDEDKYNEWMNKLTDVYQDEAQKITDAYQDSVLG